MKKQKGITLIALIITIIVMLILVGVSVNVALNGGLFKTAKQATKQTEIEGEKEQLLLIALGALNDDGIVDSNKLNTALNGTAFTANEDGTYTSTKTGKIYKVTERGSIKEVLEFDVVTRKGYKVFKFEEGMTWEDWMESGYCDSELFSLEYNGQVELDGWYCYDGLTYRYIYGSMLISTHEEWTTYMCDYRYPETFAEWEKWIYIGQPSEEYHIVIEGMTWGEFVETSLCYDYLSVDSEGYIRATSAEVNNHLYYVKDTRNGNFVKTDDIIDNLCNRESPYSWMDMN